MVKLTDHFAFQDVAAVTLKLRLAEEHAPFESREVPAWWGRAAQYLILAALTKQNGNLAKAMHDDPNTLRPYTVSSLMYYRQEDGLRHNAMYGLRFTGLSTDVSRALVSATQGDWALGKKIQLDGITFEIIGTDVDQPGRRKRQSGPKRTESITFHIMSPTFFRSHETDMPFPLPGLIFKSLLAKWNMFAPVLMEEEVATYAEKCLSIKAFDLKTAAVQSKRGARRTGATGWITFQTASYEGKWQSKIDLLTRYATYCGIGAGTTTGMGQCLTQIGGKSELSRQRNQPKYVRG